MNKIILIGNAGSAPEITTLKEGKQVAKFSLAVKEYGKNEKGEQITQWFNIVAWDKNAENLSKFLKKGQKVCIEGRVVQREYDKDGIKKLYVEVIVQTFELLSKLENSGDSESTDTTSVKETNAGSKAKPPVEEHATADSADDLPF